MEKLESAGIEILPFHYLLFLVFREVFCPTSPHVDLAAHSDGDVTPSRLGLIARYSVIIHRSPLWRQEEEMEAMRCGD